MSERLEKIKKYLSEVAKVIDDAPPELPGIILFPKFNDTKKSCVYVNGDPETIKGILIQLMRQSSEMAEIITEALQEY